LNDSGILKWRVDYYGAEEAPTVCPRTHASISYESITSPLSSILISGDSRIFIRALFRVRMRRYGARISFMTVESRVLPDSQAATGEETHEDFAL